jgi:hypothetical protein
MTRLMSSFVGCLELGAFSIECMASVDVSGDPELQANKPLTIFCTALPR